MVEWFARNDRYLAVVLKTTGKVIGFVALGGSEGERNRVYGLGYVFNADYHGQDYATEACREAIDHAFGMLGRSVRTKFQTMQTDELIAHTLRLISQGVKVACECACMAADAGMIPTGEEVLAIGGTGQGADSAVVLRATNTHTFFNTRILEIVCKPRG